MKKGKLSKGAEQDLDTVGIAQDGSIIASMTEYKEDKTNTIIKKLDPENAKVLEETTLEVYYLSDVIRGSGDYDFYFKKNDNIVGYNMKDKKEETVMSFIKSDINVDYISSTYVQDPENIYIASNDTEQMDMLALYNRVDPNELKDMKVLTVASLYGSYSIKQKVLEYNKSQKKVHVNMVDYSEADDPAAKISADIASGNLPDIYCLDMNGLGNLSTNQCIAKGLFADLTDLMANDPDANLDSLVPAVKKTLDHDGKVYFVSAAFDIVSMYGKKSEIGEGQGWTYQEMKDYVDSTDDKANMFFYSSKEDTLRELMATSGNDFVDWDKGEVHFDSADFKSVLEMCNRNHESEADGEEEYESDPEKLQNGKILFLEGTINPVEMKSYDKFFKGDVSYKGYPSKDSTGTFIRFDNSLAISSKCEDKDAAWEFIRNFITEDYQGSQYRSLDGMPTRQDVYEEYLHNYTVEKDGTDKYGNDIYALEGSFGYGELEVPVGPLSDDDIAAFQALVDSAEKSIVVDNNLVDIALEEAQAYFNGDKTVDEVTDIIQNRLGTYVNENK